VGYFTTQTWFWVQVTFYKLCICSSGAHSCVANVSREEIQVRWNPKYEAEVRPARLTDQLAWLAEIGFADVDVIWKRYNFAVYGGRKH
jgi:hypothetical protein